MKNAAYHTINPSPSFVPVGEFRQAIEHLERKLRVDRHSVVGAAETARWVEETRAVASRLSKLASKRATVNDWDRRESALDGSASAIGEILFGEV